jgi:hypothetical protein
MSIYDSLSRSSYMQVIFKFWETLTRKDHKIANTLVLFENTRNEDLCNEEWFLLAFYFLWQSFEFAFDVTRNPATGPQWVNWQEHHHKLIERGHFHWANCMSPESFDTLVEMLGNILVINESKPYTRSEAGPIIPVIRLHYLMRYITGGSYFDILCVRMCRCMFSP